VLATRHGKAEAIAPALATVGLRVVATDAVETDCFGTFTGTVARAGTMREAARAKARAGLAAMPDADFAVASEGAFGPHPAAPFATADLELVLLLDRAGTLEVVAEHATLEARAVARVVRSLDEARTVAALAGFPDHALVVRDGDDLQGRTTPRAMLVRDEAVLAAHVGAALAVAGAAVVANDLRAHANPTRLRAIRQAADALAARLASTCPRCARPGWQGTPMPGLPCAQCGTPTTVPGADAWACEGCGHREVRARDGRADASRCPRCNP
jgi:hypothetical protein